MARPKPELIPSGDERRRLATWADRPTSSQRLAPRARIVLACAGEPSNKAVAARLGVCDETVGTWRSRFVARRLEGLVDEPRPGAPRAVTDAAVEAVVTRTLETKPADATHWSTRGMAKAAGMSQSAVGRIWRAFGLKPHRPDTFELSTDPFFVGKVRGVVGLSLSPRTGPSCCAWTRSPAPRRRVGPNPSCRWPPAERSAARTTPSGTGRPRCSPPRTWPPAR